MSNQKSNPQFPKAPRVLDIPPYPFVAIGQRIRELTQQGKDIIRVDIGSPDLPPAQNVIDKLVESANLPNTHGYAGYRGLPRFRQAVANYYQTRFGVTLNPDTEVLPLIGSKEGIVNFILATVGKDDGVLVPSLAYPAYAMGTRLAEADVIEMTTNSANNYLPNLADISAADRQKAKLMWLCYPNNPTGAFANLEYYQQAADFCRENNILLALDNPYMEITFDGEPHAPSLMQIESVKDTGVEFISCSKTYNMAGWRLGAIVGAKENIDTLLIVKSNVDSGHFAAIYDAGTVAFEETTQEWLDERNMIYQTRRDMILAALDDIGLAQETMPRGSLYIWAKVVKCGGDDKQYTHDSLEKAGVSLTPGSIYGDDGHGYVRISLGISNDNLAIALKRLSDYWADKA